MLLARIADAYPQAILLNLFSCPIANALASKACASLDKSVEARQKLKGVIQKRFPILYNRSFIFSTEMAFVSRGNPTEQILHIIISILHSITDDFELRLDSQLPVAIRERAVHSVAGFKLGNIMADDASDFHGMELSLTRNLLNDLRNLASTLTTKEVIINE